MIASSRFWLLLLLVAVGAAYWPGMGGGFAFDDYPNIVMNEALHVRSLTWREINAAILSSNASDLQRPLAMLSFAVQHYFTGLDPYAMKVANLAIHLCNALLVFGLARALLTDPDSMPERNRLAEQAALMAAACWALLPINVTAVLLIVQRMEILSHTFVFAGLWLYVAGRRRQLAGLPGWSNIFVGLLLFGALGLLCKESAVLLPLYAFCIELFLFRFRSRYHPHRHYVLLYTAILFIPAMLAVAWLLPRSLAPTAYGTRDFDIVERLLTEPRVVCDYLRWSLLPSLGELGLYHDDYTVSRGLLRPPATLFALLALPVYLAVVWILRNRRPFTSLGLAWFLAAQALTATFIPLELVFEHRNYFASLGLCIALVDLLLLAPAPGARARIGWLLAGVLLLFYGSTTWLRTNEWSDPLRFAMTEAQKHPTSPRATYQLGQMYVILSEGKRDSPFAAEAFKALEQARAVPRSNILPAHGLLMLAARTGHPLRNEWWLDIEEKLVRKPVGPQELGAMGALAGCAVSRRCAFPPERMESMFQSALVRGRHPEVLNIEANYRLNVLGEAARAEQLWKECVTLSPRDVQYRINLVKLLIARDKFDEAQTHIDALRALGRLGQTELFAQQLEQRMTTRRGKPE